MQMRHLNEHICLWTVGGSQRTQRDTVRIIPHIYHTRLGIKASTLLLWGTIANPSNTVLPPLYFHILKIAYQYYQRLYGLLCRTTKHGWCQVSYLSALAEAVCTVGIRFVSSMSEPVPSSCFSACTSFIPWDTRRQGNRHLRKWGIPAFIAHFKITATEYDRNSFIFCTLFC